jgi:hypothetical protein
MAFVSSDNGTGGEIARANWLQHLATEGGGDGGERRDSDGGPHHEPVSSARISRSPSARSNLAQLLELQLAAPLLVLEQPQGCTCKASQARLPDVALLATASLSADRAI